MTKFLILITSLLSLNTFATGLTGALENASEQASFEVDPSTVYALELFNEGHEVEVSFYGDVELTYGCHNHGQDVFCHEEGHGHLQGEEETSLSHLVEGTKLALKNMKRTLERRNIDPSALAYVKAWTLENDHGHGDAVWVRFDINSNGKTLKRYIVCHEHHGEEGLFCHGSLKPQGEPTLED